MILRRVRLQSFRCFAGTVEIGPFDERITVLAGPNGAGKSTLMNAIERALFDRPDAQSSEIEALSPWGGALAPRVVVDFASGGRDYRLEKTFGPRGETLLSAWDGTRAHPFREGSSAVEWVRELLGGRAPGRGASKPEHRGLAQLLFMPQGTLELPDKLGEGALERLRSVVGAQVIDPVTRALERELELRHEQLYTPAGKPRRNAPLAALDEELRGARTEREAALFAWQSCDELRRALETAATAVRTTEERVQLLTAERERLRPLAAAHRRRTNERDLARRELEAANRAFGELAGRVQAIADLKERQRILSGKRETLTGVAEATASALADARRAVERASTAKQEHESRRAALVESRQKAEEAQKLEEAHATLADLEPRLAALRALEPRMKQHAAEVAAPGPSARDVATLRQALADERVAAERLESLKLRLRVRARAAVELVAQGETARLAAGEAREWSAEGTLTLAVGDVEVEVRGPATDVERARAEHQGCRDAVAELATRLGHGDPEALDAERARLERVKTDLEIERAEANALLRGQTLATLSGRLASARALADAISARRPELMPGAAAQLFETLRRAEAEFEDERARLAAGESAHTRALAAAQRAYDEARAAHADAHAALENAAGELRALTADGLTDETRDAARRAQSALAQRAGDAIALAEAELAKLPGEPERELDQAGRTLESLLLELGSLKKRLGQAEEAVESAARAAPYARLAAAEERASVLEEARERAYREAEAIHLLRTLFTEEQARTAARLVEPVLALVVPRLRALALPAVEALELDESFRPAALKLQGLERAIDPGELSFGTRDQLSVLVRLALGELVAGADRLPAVLDDPLVHADPERQRRFLALLEEASRSLQLVILTCRPDDYRGLAVGRFVELESSASGSATGIVGDVKVDGPRATV